MHSIANMFISLTFAPENMDTPNVQSFYIELGRLIKEKRKRILLNQSALGDSVGLSRTSITNIERGRQQVALHMLYEIASALRVEPQDLLPAKRFLEKKRTLRLSDRHLSQEVADKIAELYTEVPTKERTKEKRNASD